MGADDQPLSLYRVTLLVSGQPRTDGVAPIALRIPEYVEASDEAEAEEKALGRMRSRFHHALVEVKSIDRGCFVRWA